MVFLMSENVRISLRMAEVLTTRNDSSAKATTLWLGFEHKSMWPGWGIGSAERVRPLHGGWSHFGMVGDDCCVLR